LRKAFIFKLLRPGLYLQTFLAKGFISQNPVVKELKGKGKPRSAVAFRGFRFRVEVVGHRSAMALTRKSYLYTVPEPPLVLPPVEVPPPEVLPPVPQ